MNCYFCHNPLMGDKRFTATEHAFYDSCAHCSNQGDILGVYTNEKYVSFYLGIDYKVIEMQSPRFFMRPSYLEVGRKYQIRLNLKDNTTDIIEVYGDSFSHLLNLPGFPINLNNAKDKLKLYMTFS